MNGTARKTRMFSIAIAAVAVAVFAGWLFWKNAADGGNGNLYRNPVFEPVLADPSVVRAADGKFYAYGTEDDWGDGEGPRFIPIVTSSDLTHWEYVREAFDVKPLWKDSGGLWAPDVSLLNGKYYMYYSFSVWGDPNPGIGVATADNPGGPFTDHGKLFTSEEIGVENSIDPMLFVDDGTPYLFWGSFHGIYGVKLSKDGLHAEGEKFQIAGPSFEAAYIIKRDDFYYFLGSSGSCCEGASSSYWVSAARSKSLQGPYLNAEGKDIMETTGTPVVSGDILGTEGEPQFVGPGHNSVVRDDEGTDWLLYHAIDAADGELAGGASRRPLMIDPIVWTDGWPALKNITPGNKERTGPVIDPSNQ